MSADLEFYFDPVCPWAWITSRWVTNVQQLRNYEVSWKFISLRMVNAERGYANNSRYEAIHRDGRRDLLESPHAFLSEIAVSASLPKTIADAYTEDAHDEVIRFETEAALSRTGKDVGTPILTFNPKSAQEASLFGPVISQAPHGDEALRLWDAVQTIAELGVAEIKRSLRSAPRFD
jgi:hypothetical protein